MIPVFSGVRFKKSGLSAGVRGFACMAIEAAGVEAFGTWAQILSRETQENGEIVARRVYTTISLHLSSHQKASVRELLRRIHQRLACRNVIHNSFAVDVHLNAVHVLDLCFLDFLRSIEFISIKHQSQLRLRRHLILASESSYYPLTRGCLEYISMCF